jgi:hypothetical protein
MSKIKYLDLAGLTAYDTKIKQWFKSSIDDITDDAIRVLFVTTGPANNEIWYTSKDGKVVAPYAADVFGANIVSNTYKDDKGVIVFDGPITNIGGDAFYCCMGLTSVVIPDSVTSIGSWAFSDCFYLTSMVIPDGVTSIGESAFENCDSLTSIVIPDGVTSIGDAAFNCCSGMTSIVIPESVTSIGTSALSGCLSLTSITFEGTMEEWDGIEKGMDWHTNDVPATYVQCTDGQVLL